jgi:hypothetical protein
MASHHRLMLPFAAAVAVAAALSIAPPASAAGAIIGEAASATARSADVRHRTSQRMRFAASRDHRRDRDVRPIRNLDCSGAWCGRQFVLMIGIAY